jgi:hypothetical protein
MTWQPHNRAVPRQLSPRQVFSVLRFAGFSSPPPLLSLPNPNCIQHTMRFASWSTSANAFILVSTFALLLGLIPAANAALVSVTFDDPRIGDLVSSTDWRNGKRMITWYVPERGNRASHDRSLTVGIPGPLKT